MYAGPEPLMAVTASWWYSGSSTTLPVASSRARARARWAASQWVPGLIAAMPSSTSAGVFGMTRTTATPSGSRSSTNAVVMPAAMLTTSAPGRSSPATSASSAAMSCGFTTSTTVSLDAAASVFVVVRTPYRPAISAARSGRRSLTTTSAGDQPARSRPETSVSPMTPPPRMATVSATRSSSPSVDGAQATRRDPGPLRGFRPAASGGDGGPAGEQRAGDLSGCARRGTGCVRRLRRVLESELDRLGRRVPGDLPGERERHVDAGRDARGGDVLAVAHHSFVDGDGPEGRQLLADQPVRRRTPARQQPGGGEQQGPGADRRRPGARAVGPAQPPSYGAVVHVGVLPRAAGHDDDVGLGHFPEGRVRDQTQAADLVHNRARLLRDQDDVRTGQVTQDVVRPHDVQGGEALAEQDRDLHPTTPC